MAKFKIGTWEVEATQFTGANQADLETLHELSAKNIGVDYIANDARHSETLLDFGDVVLKTSDWLLKESVSLNRYGFSVCSNDQFQNKIDMALLKELVGDTCRCGVLKEPHRSFCQTCYFSLPPHLQRNMYKRLGKGYRESYYEAVAYLEAKG